MRDKRRIQEVYFPSTVETIYSNLAKSQIVGEEINTKQSVRKNLFLIPNKRIVQTLTLQKGFHFSLAS